MGWLVRWRTRLNIDNRASDEDKRLAGWDRRRNKTKRRWPAARTAFDWAAYANRSQSLRLLHRTQAHVDTTVRTSEGTYVEAVHWQVISAFCPKLLDQSIVSCNQSNKAKIYYTVELPKLVSAPIARLLIESAYGEQELGLDRSNLQEFYIIATRYAIDHAINICLEYARTILDVNNCIYLLQLSLAHKHQKLRRATYNVLRANFKLIIHVNKDFHTLEAKHLRQLLLDDSLRINEDEELAWLAIVRWLSGRILTQVELARVYNQMVSEPQEVRRLWSPSQQASQQQRLNQVETSQPARVQSQPQRIRLTLDFYSPANPIESEADTRNRAKHWTSGGLSPLRAPAEQIKNREAFSVHDGEEELYRLLKCLRFMRFKSVSAFDAILRDPRVQQSAKLTVLVHHMRLRYKLRHKIPLTDVDRQMLDPGEMRKLKNRETNKAQRIVKFVRKLVNSTLHPRPVVGVAANDLPVQAVANVLERGASHAGSHITPELIHKQFGERSLNRANRPRVPTSVGLLIGGWQDGSVTNTIWAYDFVFDKWFKLNIKLPEARAFHASCSTPRGHVYIFGGTNGKAILDSVLRFHPASDVFIRARHRYEGARGVKQTLREPRNATLVYKFKQLCSMNERRCHLSGVFHSDGRLYALGGHNGTQRLRSGEWYDPKSNQWHPIADMTIARADAAACSHGNKIFIAGGQISDQFIQSSVEFYKSSDNTWTFAAPMIIPRMSFSLASHRGHLLAIGGTNGLMGGEEVASVTRSVERYNYNAGAWYLCAPMVQKRCAFGVMQIENKLLVMGGHGGRRRLKTCESLRVGHFTSSQPLMSSVSSMISESLRQRLGRVALSSGSEETRAQSAAPGAPAPSNQSSMTNPGKSVQPNQQQHQQRQQQRPSSEPQGQQQTTRSSAIRSLPDLASLARNQLAASDLHLPVRSAMKWVPRSKLPERRSGFSIAVVNKLQNARQFTYFGSVKSTSIRDCKNNLKDDGCRCRAPLKTSFIKQPGRWHRFKIMKRRKLVKHLKIALIVTIVILMM